MSVRKLPLRRRSMGTVSPKRLYRNLSVKLRSGDAPVSDVLETSKHHYKAASRYKSLWEAVENEDTLVVQCLLSKDGGEDSGGEKRQAKEGEIEEEQDTGVNELSEEGLVPLDVAILTQNSLLLHILVKAGAKHNPHVCSCSEWASKLHSLVEQAGLKVGQWREVMLERTGQQAQADAQRNLRVWTLRRQLYCRMRDTFHRTVLPGPPTSVSLQVTGANLLSVSFREPAGSSAGLVSCYKVEWSTSGSFQPVIGSGLIVDIQNLSYSITGLEFGVHYFVRVSAYNIKGWGPAQSSRPLSAAPSSWRECSGVKLRCRNQTKGVKRLLERTREPQYRGYCREGSRQPGPSKRLSLSHGLKQLFHSATKFVHLLQRGVYLAAVFYYNENILTTSNNQLPLVEIQNCSASITQDFLWFAKLSCAWEQVPWLQQALSSSLCSSSSLLQRRHNILQAIAHLQSSLGTVDLGQMYYEPLKDRQGNILLVTLKECVSPVPPSNPQLRWAPLTHMEKSRREAPLVPNPTAADVFTEQLKGKLCYHKRSVQKAHAGLYVGVLKLCSSEEQIRILVPQKLPNLLCHTRVRQNPHVSREEWAWLQSLSMIGSGGSGQPMTVTSVDHESSGMKDCVPEDFVKALRTAITHLLTKLCIPLHRTHEYRVYTQELLQFGDGQSLLLLLPPSKDVSSSRRTVEGSTDGGFTLPLQIFELVHFWAYEREFLSQYCQVWVRLELDTHLAQQALREALDSREIQEAKERLDHVTCLSQSLDTMWREKRWITDALQCVRSKHSIGVAPLAMVMGEELTIPATNQHKAHQQEGNTIQRLAPVNISGSQSPGAGSAADIRDAKQGVCSAEETRKDKGDHVYGADEDHDGNTGQRAHSIPEPAAQCTLDTAHCTLDTHFHTSNSDNSLSVAKPHHAGQLGPKSLKNGNLVSRVMDSFYRFGLEANNTSTLHSSGESEFQVHHNKLDSDDDKHTNTYFCYHGRSTNETADHWTLEDELSVRVGSGLDNSSFLGDLEDPFTPSIPINVQVDGGALKQSGMGYSLPTRSLVEWVCSPPE